MTLLREVQATIAELYPPSDAEDWDAVGLVSGDPDTEVQRIALGVDAVDQTVSAALAQGAQLLFVHHPLILRGVTTVAEDRYKGRLIARLIRANCALITAHTNADVVEYGPTGAIMRLLDVRDTTPITPLDHRHDRGLGLVGTLPEPISLRAFAERVARIIPATAGGVRVAGNPALPVQRVACCSGAGDSLLNDPAVTSADVYVTSDLRHHPASEAREQALLRGGTPALVDISHAASEWLWLSDAAARIQQAHPDVQCEVLTTNTDPWTFLIGQESLIGQDSAEWTAS